MASLRRAVHRLLWPKMRIVNPPLYAIMASLTVTHLLLGLASLFGPHGGMLWDCIGTVGLIGLGVAHLTLVAALTIGVFGRFPIARAALLASVTLYLMKSCLFTAAILYSYKVPGAQRLAWEPPLFTIGLLLLSVNAYWHPLASGEPARRLI